MAEVKRIANLVPAGAGGLDTFTLPDGGIGAGFRTEPWELVQPVAFVTEVDRTIAALLYAEAAVRAEEAGFAAAIVNSAGDYGVGLARSVCSIPVVGAGQAAMNVAIGIGTRFGIVTVWPPQMATTYERIINENGFQSRCTGVRFASTNDELARNLTESFAQKLRVETAPIMERIENAARESVRDGADVLVLGCICMVGIRDELENRLGVPVVNPLLAAQKYAELLTSMDYTPTIPYNVAEQRAYLRAGVTAGSWSTDGGAECGDACEVLSAIPVASPQPVY